MTRYVPIALAVLLTVQAGAQGQTRRLSRTAWAQDVPAQAAPTQLPMPAPAPGQAPAAVTEAPAPGPVVVPDDGARPGEWGPGFGNVDGRFWVRADYLLWWGKGVSTPALVSSSPAGAAQDVAGLLSQPTTTVAFGSGSYLDTAARNGGRLELGWHLDPQGQYALVANFFVLADVSTNAQFHSDGGGSPILAVPYTNWATGQAAAQLIAYPGVSNGAVAISSASSLWGDELYLRRYLFGPMNPAEGGLRLDWVVGVRYLRLRERLALITQSTALADSGTVTAGTLTTTSDNFDTENYAWAGEFGAVAQWQFDRLTLGVTGKLGFAANHHIIEINGASRQDIPGGSPVSSSSGILAQATNIGRSGGSAFSFIPEVGLQASYALTPSVRLIAGYTFLYWTNVVRPGDQIDTTINTSQLNGGTLTGSRRPANPNAYSDVWFQGANLGVQFCW